MEVYQMHLAIDQGFNQVASSRERKILPEEKDWHLNKAQERMIQKCLKPKDNGAFEIDQLQADKIRPLIVSYKDLVPYIAEEQSRYKCFLPHDYSYLLSDWSLTALDKVQTTAESKLYMKSIQQTLSVKANAPFYATNIIRIGDSSVSVPAELNYGHKYTGFPKTQDIAFLAQYVALKGGWYWQKGAGFNKPGHYIRISTTPIVGSTQATVDGVVHTQSTLSDQTFKIHTGTNGKKVTNRLLPSNKVHEMHIPFYKTAHYSPVSELSGDILYVYNDGSFIVTGVGISYVRKPQPISLSLNTTSELPEEFHQSLCDLVVEMLKGRVENIPGTQLAERDIEKRVTL